MFVNTQSLRVELLAPDSSDYVKPGEIGRVVITDLYNRSMPLIRYDTGDFAVSHDDSSCVRIENYEEGVVMMMYDSVVICKPNELVK